MNGTDVWAAAGGEPVLVVVGGPHGVSGEDQEGLPDTRLQAVPNLDWDRKQWVGGNGVSVVGIPCGLQAARGRLGLEGVSQAAELWGFEASREVHCSLACSGYKGARYTAPDCCGSQCHPQARGPWETHILHTRRRLPWDTAPHNKRSFQTPNYERNPETEALKIGLRLSFLFRTLSFGSDPLARQLAQLSHSWKQSCLVSLSVCPVHHIPTKKRYKSSECRRPKLLCRCIRNNGFILCVLSLSLGACFGWLASWALATRS